MTDQLKLHHLSLTGDDIEKLANNPGEILARIRAELLGKAEVLGVQNRGPISDVRMEVSADVRHAIMEIDFAKSDKTIVTERVSVTRLPQEFMVSEETIEPLNPTEYAKPKPSENSTENAQKEVKSIKDELIKQGISSDDIELNQGIYDSARQNAAIDVKVGERVVHVVGYEEECGYQATRDASNFGTNFYGGSYCGKRGAVAYLLGGHFNNMHTDPTVKSMYDEKLAEIWNKLSHIADN